MINQTMFPSPRVALRHLGTSKALRLLALAFVLLPFITIVAVVLLVSLGPARAPSREAITRALAAAVTLFVSSPLVWLLSLLVGRRREGSPAALSLDGLTLVIDRDGTTERLAPGTLRAGYVNAETGRLELENRWGNVLEIDLPSLTHGHALLSSLGLERSTATIAFPVGESALFSVIASLFAVVIGGGTGVGLAKDLYIAGPFALLTGLLGFASLRWALLSLLGPATLSFEQRGVRLSQRFRSTFIPFGQLERFDITEAAVTFTLRDGSKLEAAGWNVLSTNGERIRDRLTHALRAHAAADASVHTRAQLSRLGRPLDAWRGSLSALLRRDDYRDAPVERDDLWAIATSPTEAAEHRIGAALSLLSQPERGEPLHERLRVAAASSASDKLRVALERLAEGRADDALLEAALDDDERRRRGESV